MEFALNTTGEVQANGYASSLITPRIPSIVVQRLVRLGDKVSKGQALVTLFSVEMAETQSRFINISQEWSRLKKLGRDIVSTKRYIQAETDYLQTVAQLKAYGMSDAEITKLKQQKRLPKPGEYQLYAPQDGTITTDDFQTGALIDSGTPLFEINDEKTVWIESPLSPSQFEQAFLANRALIKSDTYQGEAQIVTAHEKLDPTTRHRKMRLVVSNPDHKLHAGQYVDVSFQISTETKAISVPKEAVLRSPDGDWVLFIQDEDGGFLPREVEINQAAGDRYVVSGINAGEKVVTKGAFFIQSELAKAGFSVHNH